MKKISKKKLIGIIASVIVALLLVVDILGANYLVSFAVGRSTSGGASVAPPSVTSDATKDVVSANRKAINDATKEWFDSLTVNQESIMSDDGLRLAAESVMAEEESHKWAIVIHGYSGRHDYMWNYGKVFYEAGYNILLPDMRGHGASDGDYIGMGWPDRKDVLKWINLVIERDPQAEIILHGVSMGGGTVMMTSGEDLPSNVKAIVEDCGYTSVWDIFSDEMKALFNLPDFPLLHTANIICKLRAGYTFTEASAIKQVAKAKVPMLFLHGGEDNFVHTDMIYKVYEACNTKKDMMVIPNAGHGEAYYYDPEGYTGKIFEFLGDIL